MKLSMPCSSPSPPSTTTLQWLSLVAIIWLQSINGTNTNFPAYSSQLKELLSISQIQLNNLAFASDAGKLFGWFSGLASLYLPLWLVLIIGSTLGLIGYGVQYLFLTHHISNLSYWHVFLLTFLAGNSICWINTVCYVVTIKNFFSHSQVAVGITTSYQGLSAKVYTNVVDAFFSPHKNKARAFLFLNSVLPLAIALLVAPILRETKKNTSNFSHHYNHHNYYYGFGVVFVITIATGVYAVVSSLEFVSSKISSLGILIGILVSLFLPLLVPISVKMNELAKSWHENKEKLRVYHYTLEENYTTSTTNEVKESEEEGGKEVCVREEIGVKLMVKRIDFWLYFFVYLFGATIGLVYLNNLGQIAESRGSSNTSSLVSLSSSFGFFGRLIPSLMDYFHRGKSRISRPACMVALTAPISCAFFLLQNSTEISLYISTAVIGVCTGAITSIAVSTTTELFGTNHFSVNHNVVVANIPMGSFIFGYSAAILYHKEGHNSNITNDHGQCMGMNCFANTFKIWGCFCFLGTFLALILYARTRKFYSI
ncbi:hypothetical protein PIB30_077962 [Stylosanthes scabra]|uniref:Nodulin-like domain-containing protein n=1 Tax=Stylosanthes scabra TaxID=79078 RepID=A0ABU6ZPA4_9FABA|nr:hypothetical protein [Stylosanthes scabra]